jgi:hypothetical protein
MGTIACIVLAPSQGKLTAVAWSGCGSQSKGLQGSGFPLPLVTEQRALKIAMASLRASGAEDGIPLKNIFTIAGAHDTRRPKPRVRKEHLIR